MSWARRCWRGEYAFVQATISELRSGNRDVSSYRVQEAKQAYTAEEAGLIPGPLSRPAGVAADVIDGAGVPWSIKGTGTKPDVDWTVGKIVGEARKNMRCIADLREMSMKEQAAVRTIVIDRLKGMSHPEIRFLPPGVERIPAQ